MSARDTSRSIQYRLTDLAVSIQNGTQRAAASTLEIEATTPGLRIP